MERAGRGEFARAFGLVFGKVEPTEVVAEVTARKGADGPRTTQVWDATVTPEGASKSIAQFRCAQMVLWPKA